MFSPLDCLNKILGVGSSPLPDCLFYYEREIVRPSTASLYISTLGL
jgi:hypothetical protein